jgi:hypothetical protein
MRARGFSQITPLDLSSRPDRLDDLLHAGDAVVVVAEDRRDIDFACHLGDAAVHPRLAELVIAGVGH